MTQARPDFLPYGRQSIDEDDIEAVVRVLKSDYLTTGPAVPEFEARFAEAFDVPSAAVVSSGTAALHLMYLALGIGPGSIVIVPSITFVASANAAIACGAEVVFADVDPRSGLITRETALEALERARHRPGRVAAILAVHMNGWCADLVGLQEVARSADVMLLEDACHGIGGRISDAQGASHWVGNCTFSEAATFSLHPVKSMTMGEGGVVCARDPEVAETVRRLRNHGITRDPGQFQDKERGFDAEGRPKPWYYEQQALGLNYRATDFQCALGLSQLKKLPHFAGQRRTLQALYDHYLAALAPAVVPVPAHISQDPCLHLYAVHIAGKGRTDVMRALRERGIGTQVHYGPVHRQPYHAERHGDGPLPGADSYASSILSLPFYPGLSEDDVKRVVGALSDVLGP